MNTKTSIEWTTMTWNPTRGCTKVGQECDNCYAMSIAHRFSGLGKPFEGLTRMIGGRGQWNGQVRTAPGNWEAPFSWRTPSMVFVDSMSDLFHEGFAGFDIAIILGIAVAAVHLRGHTFQILTKRAERLAELTNAEAFWEVVNSVASREVMERTDPLNRRTDDARATLQEYGPESPPPGIWLGVSCGTRADGLPRVDQLRRVPAAMRFLSCEPLLEHLGQIDLAGIGWVIAGGESGPRARRCDVRWIRSIVQQCKVAGVPCFVKQLGAFIVDRNDAGFDADEETYVDTGLPVNERAWPSTVDTEHNINDYREHYQGADCRVRLKDRKGGDMDQWPLNLRVREFPRAT